MNLKRFYRPEDISIDAAYKAELYEVYSSDDKRCVDVDSLVGRCFVGPEAGAPGQAAPALSVVCNALYNALYKPCHMTSTPVSHAAPV